MNISFFRSYKHKKFTYNPLYYNQQKEDLEERIRRIEREVKGYRNEDSYYPGNIWVSQTHGTYPSSGSGTLNQYAADYVKFTNLGDTYDIFVFIPHNLTESTTASYSYTGRLGSFLLSIDGLFPGPRLQGR